MIVTLTQNQRTNLPLRIRVRLVGLMMMQEAYHHIMMEIQVIKWKMNNKFHNKMRRGPKSQALNKGY